MASKVHIVPKYDDDPISFEQFTTAVSLNPDLELDEPDRSARWKQAEDCVLRFRAGEVECDLPAGDEIEEKALGLVAYLTRQLGNAKLRRGNKRLMVKDWIHHYDPPPPKKVVPVKDGPVRRYAPAETFAEGDRIEHPKFGAGRVERVAGKQVEVKFEDGTVRKLAHGLVTGGA